jgi:5-methylcytosine-specific restriction enzyme A
MGKLKQLSPRLSTLPPMVSPQGPRTEAERTRWRRETQPWFRWYSTARWQRMRAAQLAKEPLCEFCQKAGHVTLATVADHVEAHRGDPALFWNPANLQSLCQSHHSSDKQRIERGGKPKPVIGIDGWPI